MKNVGFVIVTGGTHGIGKAAVIDLTKKGYRVFFTGRDVSSGEQLEKSCEGASFQVCDLTNAQSTKQWIHEVMASTDGKMDGLVNNAGVSLRSAFHETSLEDWDRIMSVNARSVYHITRLCIQGLIASKGSVVTVSSVAGFFGQKELSIYTASKAALIGLTQALALEYGESVRFNAICPGQIGTRMMQKVTEDQNRLNATKARIPASRLGTPEEVANVIAWLIGKNSTFINGTVIPVDGGESAGIL